MKTEDYKQTIADYIIAMRPSAYSFTKNRDDAHDLLQETFLRAVSKENTLNENINIKGWLYVMMKNIFINNYRRSKTRHAVVETQGDLSFLYSNSSCVENEAESTMAMENLNKVIYRMEEKFRLPFMMYHNGFKYQEIAENLSMNMGSVKCRIHIARKDLQAKLA